MAETKTYAGAVSSAILQGVTAGAWVAAGGLSPGRRRLVRAGLVAAGMGVGMVQARRAVRPEEPHLLDSPILVKDVLAREVPDEAEAERKLPSRAALVGIGVSTGLAVGGRWLEKRWLARLARNGHARPHRALGVRMGLLTAGTILVSELFTVAEAGRATRTAEREHTGEAERN